MSCRSSKVCFLCPGICGLVVFPKVLHIGSAHVTCAYISFCPDRERYCFVPGASAKICFLCPGVRSGIILPQVLAVGRHAVIPCSHISFRSYGKTKGQSSHPS